MSSSNWGLVKDNSTKGLGVFVSRCGLQRTRGCGRSDSLQAVIKSKADMTHYPKGWGCEGKRAAAQVVFGAAKLSQGSEGKDTGGAAG